METEISDENLVSNYLRGDEQALEVLIKKYLSPIFNFSFKYVASQEEAEDVTQETFVKIWKNIKRFDNRFKFKTWAFTIAKNTALDRIKKKGLIPFVELENGQGETENNFSNSLVSYEPLPEQALSTLEDSAMIGREVKKLPDKYRQVLTLYYHQELNFREIAERLKVSIDTIKTRHRRAVIYLKRQVTDRN